MEQQGTFNELGLDERLAAKARERGISEPTEVQRVSLPVLLAGRDAVIRSQTGSGKTLAYLWPLLQRISPEAARPQALVLAPTRELAMQIFEEAKAYAECLGLRTAALIGGANLQRQIDKLKEHPQVLIGTPGRVLELVKSGKLKLAEAGALVADEADQLYELGNARDIDEIIGRLPRSRQLIFASATESEASAAAARRSMREPTMIWTAQGGVVPEQIGHGYVVCEDRDKVEALRKLMHTAQGKSAFVFVGDTDSIGEVAGKLRYRGIEADALYSEAGKQERAGVMRAFRSGEARCLITTDLAARGMDVPGIPLVVHYDPAPDAAHYLHRAGRTGRMGRPGLSLTLVTEKQRFIMRKFAQALQLPFEEYELKGGELKPAAKKGQARRGARSETGAPERRDAGRRTAARAQDGGAQEAGRTAHQTSQAGGTEGGGGKAKRSDRPYRTDRPDRAPERPKQARGEARTEKARRNGLRGPSSGGTPPPARVSAAKPKVDKKNKGAPRWLKAKWKEESAPKSTTASTDPPPTHP